MLRGKDVSFALVPSIFVLLFMLLYRTVPRDVTTSQVLRSPEHEWLHPVDSLPPAACLLKDASHLCLELTSDREYESFASSCTWDDAGNRLDMLWLFQSMNGSDRSMMPHKAFRCNVCTNEKFARWIAYRIGPFVTGGGFEWGGFGGVINSQYLPTYRGTNLHAFSSYALGNVDDNNALAGYPPIHQHHWHFGEGFSMHEGANMQNHADNQCHSDEGGVMCLVRKAPREHAWILTPRLLPWTEFNDVRFLESRH